jgi:hypothetical protein
MTRHPVNDEPCMCGTPFTCLATHGEPEPWQPVSSDWARKAAKEATAAAVKAAREKRLAAAKEGK